MLPVLKMHQGGQKHLSTVVQKQECMWPGSTVSDLLETLSVLQVQNQAVGTQVYFVLGLRHLEVKKSHQKCLLMSVKRKLRVQRLLPGNKSAVKYSCPPTQSYRFRYVLCGADLPEFQITRVFCDCLTQLLEDRGITQFGLKNCSRWGGAEDGRGF